MPLTIVGNIGYKEFSFLIDTGATVSIIPSKSIYTGCLQSCDIKLSSASGGEIKVHGEIDLNLNLPNIRRSFRWTFIVADVVTPIIGIDFLAKHNLLVDTSKRVLVDSATNLNAPLDVASIKIDTPKFDLSNFSAEIQSMLLSYQSLFTPSPSKNKKEIKVTHIIDTGDERPVFCKARPLTGTKLEAAKNEFQRMLEEGIVQRSNSAWSSPLHLVPKDDNSYRPCGDFRRINNISKSDSYPIPNIRSIISSFHGKKVFSKIDLKKAYLQIPVEPEDVPKTAVSTPFGLFEFLKMPFGLKNAGATFQRYMDTLFSSLPNVECYIDDIIVASDDEISHMKDLEEVFKILEENGLKISVEKCEFVKKSLIFLGYEISDVGIRPPTTTSKLISEYPIPKTSSDLRRFMGMLNFFRIMIPKFSTIAYPITELLRLNPSSKELYWSDSAVAAFNDLKLAFLDCPTLSYPSHESGIYQLVTDSSNYAVGAALYQMIDSIPHPVGFYSKKLSVTQRSYSTYDRELLAAYFAVIHFKPFIDGHSVDLFVDHKPLVSAFHSKNVSKSDRQQRQLAFISEYVHDVKYIKGSNNVVADCLSRPINAINVDLFDLSGISTAQENSKEELEPHMQNLTRFEVKPDVFVWCDTSTPSPRPFIPSCIRKQVISSLHSLAHPGFKTLSKLVKQRYFWSFMDTDVKSFVRSCEDCQKSKVNRHTRSHIEPISQQSDRLSTIHIDIVGPLPPAYVSDHKYILPYRYILTCIDRATRWPEAIPLVDTTAHSVAIALVSGWISRLGVPLQLVTDRGVQFESELFSEIASIVGFNHIRTTSYHPQSNGIIERFHRTMKAAIMARKENWFTALPVVMLGLRMSPTANGYSPFTNLTGAFMLVPHPFFSSENLHCNKDTTKILVEDMRRLDFGSNAEGIIHSNSTVYLPEDLKSCEKVWVRIDRIKKSLEAPYSGPFEVLKRYDKFFIVSFPSGSKSISIDRLKPYFPPKELSAKPTVKMNPVRPSGNGEGKIVKTRSGRTVKFAKDPNVIYF